jgi:hypothetical protein
MLKSYGTKIRSEIKNTGIFNLFQRQSEEVNPAEVRTVSRGCNPFYSKHGERELPIFLAYFARFAKRLTPNVARTAITGCNPFCSKGKVG